MGLYCAVCNNDTFTVQDGWDSDERILLCTVCGEDVIDYVNGDDEYENYM